MLTNMTTFKPLKKFRLLFLSYLIRSRPLWTIENHSTYFGMSTVKIKTKTECLKDRKNIGTAIPRRERSIDTDLVSRGAKRAEVVSRLSVVNFSVGVFIILR